MHHRRRSTDETWRRALDLYWVALGVAGFYYRLPKTIHLADPTSLSLSELIDLTSSIAAYFPRK